MQIALVTGGDGPALLTPPGAPAFIDAVDLPLVAALEERGAVVARPRWDDPEVDWARFELALVRTTWDYTTRRDEFLAWAMSTGDLTRLWNPAEVLRWNTHKSYLLELEERGAPVVPTAWLARGDRIDLAELVASRGWGRTVVKPAVASSSDGMARVEPGALADGQRHLDGLLARGDALVQPYLEAIEIRGELSIVVVDGAASHAVRKLPPAGEYRVQEEFGAAATAEALDRDAAALAEWVVAATGTTLLLARVDLLEDDAGGLQLLELEATEPDLFLTMVPEAAGTVADAVLRKVAS